MLCFSLMFMLMESVICPIEPPPILQLTDYPAVVMAYDPGLGGVNCDGDCSTIATGPLTQDMYGTVAACHQDLLGQTVNLPGIGSFECLDTGTAVRVHWNEHFQQMVLYFDVMKDLRNEDRPQWAGTLVTDWSLN